MDDIELMSVRTVNDDYKIIIAFFNRKKKQVLKAIQYREFGAKEGNEHYHYQFDFKSDGVKVDTIMKYLRQELHERYGNSNYYVSKVKDETKHLGYIAKGFELVNHQGYSEELLDKLVKDAKVVAEDKSKSVARKLADRWIKSTDEGGGSVAAVEAHRVDIILWILKQYKEWKSLPPSKFLMHQYVNYIIMDHSQSDSEPFSQLATWYNT